jgi:hypothetical protein
MSKMALLSIAINIVVILFWVPAQKKRKYKNKSKYMFWKNKKIIAEDAKAPRKWLKIG